MTARTAADLVASLAEVARFVDSVGARPWSVYANDTSVHVHLLDRSDLRKVARAMDPQPLEVLKAGMSYAVGSVEGVTVEFYTGAEDVAA